MFREKKKKVQEKYIRCTYVCVSEGTKGDFVFVERLAHLVFPTTALEVEIAARDESVF